VISEWNFTADKMPEQGALRLRVGESKTDKKPKTGLRDIRQTPKILPVGGNTPTPNIQPVGGNTLPSSEPRVSFNAQNDVKVIPNRDGDI